MEGKRIFDTDRRIRLGIWGLGRGAHFIKAAAALNVDVVAGCDLNPLMREEFAKLCPGVRVYEKDTDFLADKEMDAVLVATFFTAHAEHAIRALEAGFHVMSEVTSFFTPAEGVRLVEAVEKSGKVYQLLENYPFTKENLYLKSLWEQGFFGEFQYGEFEYLHQCRSLCYSYILPGSPPVVPGSTAHSWRSWLDFHYYNTHSLGPLMQITGLRPEMVTAFPGTVSLPGYLPGSGMAKACPSLIRMSNGGILRNLTGATTGDCHMGKQIWGTRASAGNRKGRLSLRIGGNGSAPEFSVEPVWPELGEFADTMGHGGGDFWELYYFAREILTGEPGPWNVCSACDVTLTGIMAVKSEQSGGTPQTVPDFRDPAVREQYRNDDFRQEHFDPCAIFPADHGADAEDFCPLMLALGREITRFRRIFDGAKIYDRLTDAASRLAILNDLIEARKELRRWEEHFSSARRLIAAYPDAPAAFALKGMLSLAEPEASRFSGDAMKQELDRLEEFFASSPIAK